MRVLLSLLVLFSLIFQAGDYQITVGQVDSTAFPEITVFVNVDDASGNPVVTLQREDFKLREDGKDVEVIDFAGMGDSRPVDVVFVFDTTGSMAEEINGVIETSVKFAEELQSQGRDYRLGLVTFGDKVRGIYQNDGSLTDDAEEFKGWVQTLSASGGDDDPENTYGALKAAATRMQFREESQIIFLLITDAPAHVTGDAPEPEGGFEDPDLTIERSLALLKDPRPITVYPVTLEDPDFHRLADETGGTFYLLSAGVDFTGIITTISEVIATQYRITYRTPRDVDDGTRREIEVQVGESKDTGGYIESHLINIHSNLLIGLACLFPLLLGLLVPFAWQMISRQSGSRRSRPPSPAPGPAQGQYPPPYPQQAGPQGYAPPQAATPPPAPAQQGYPQGSYNPPSTWSVGQQQAPAPAASPSCVHCGAPIRAGAKFCAKCGQQQPAAPVPPVAQPPTPYPQMPTAQPGGYQQPPTVQPPAAQGAASTSGHQFCPNCGAPIRPGAKFCARCGNPSVK